MAKDKRRVGLGNTKKPKHNVFNPIEPDTHSTVIINFSYVDWLKSTNNKWYTNKLQSENQFAEYMFEVFYKIIPMIQNDWKSIVAGKNYHSHLIKKEKLEMVETITESIHGKRFLTDQTEDLSYWSLGQSQGVRLVAIFNRSINTIFPMFVDYHHLLYADKNHNSPDYGNYSFCPFCEYSKSKITLP